MKLYAYNIGGQPVGTVVQSWSADDLAGNTAFVFSETPISGYTDISSVENLCSFGHNADHDFKFVRDVMKEFVIAAGTGLIIATVDDPTTITPSTGENYLVGNAPVGDFTGHAGHVATYTGITWTFIEGDGYASPLESLGFETLTADEKKKAASNLIGMVAQQIAAFATQDEKTSTQAMYKNLVQKCRQNRYKWVENYVLQMIPLNAGAMLSVILTNGLHFMYRDQGVDGLSFGDPIAGLADYVYGTGPFVGTGLKDMPWTTIYGDNMTTFSNFIGDKLFITGLTKQEENIVS